MKHFKKLLFRFEAWPIKRQIEQHHHLWGEHPERIDFEDSPHVQSQDIWLRFRDQSELHQPSDYGMPHWPVWYPAWKQLTSLHSLVFHIAHEVKATDIGGILMTRIPAGASILPHVDTGWHPEHFSKKCYAIIKANAWCVNRCMDEEVIMREGECWLFDNSVTHSVDNAGSGDRIAMIVTMRTT